MNQTTHKKLKGKNRLLKSINSISILVLLSSFCIAIFYAYRLRLIPNRLLIIGGVVVGVFVLVLSFTLIASKSKSIIRGIFLNLLSLLLIAGFIASIFMSNQTSNFVSNLSAADYEQVSYSIAALSTENVTLNQNNRTIGYLKDDPNNNAVLKEVKSHVNASPTASDNITALTVSLSDKNVSSIVIRDSSLELLSENYKTFYDNLIILKTFTIKVVKDTAIKQTDVTKPFAVYISGIDTYGELNKVARSDVNILAIINPLDNKILLVNTPRDYYVQLHGTTGYKDKLTHAGVYGIEMSRATMEDLYGTDIDYYVRINFSSLEKTVDLLGGITVDSEVAFKAGKYTFVEGPNNLDGKAALVFSRERYGFSEGDRQRGKNQQKVLSAVVEKATSPAVIVRNQSLLRALEGVFQTDAPNQVITDIIRRQLETVGRWKVESISVTGSGSSDFTYSMGSVPLYVMIPDLDSVNSAKARIAEYLNQPVL